MIDLCIDARMAFCSGIGTCIRELVPLINHPPFRVILLVDRENQSWCKGMEQILFSVPIYSAKEQVLYPLKIPPCDLFWSPHYNVPLLPIKSRKRVVTIHDACHLALKQYFPPLQRVLAKAVMYAALHRSDAAITNSRFSQSELIRYLGKPKKNLQVVYMGGKRDSFKRITDVRPLEQIRQKYQLPSKYILFVGNLKPHKNLSALTNAFSHLNREGLGLVIAGKGDSANKIQGKEIYNIGEVLDWELPLLYSLAEVFVFPSFYEGFGLPPLEAMGCGCPTIVSHCSSLPEVCGDASIYINPCHPHEISDAIQRIGEDSQLKAALIAKGYERVKSFNWLDTATQYRKIFEEVCN